MNLKRMGVINLTPDSFSDGGEISSHEALLKKIKKFGPIDILDVGAESTAPKNAAITADEEWKRLEPYLKTLVSVNIPISVDTYHPETINKVAKFWLDEKIAQRLIWNDVSGKFDQEVKKFLQLSDNFSYVFCHNLAPSRAQTSKHMDYVSLKKGGDFLKELSAYFRTFSQPRIIFDPCLGFSKTYDQNWSIIENFGKLQGMLGHEEWLLGFSRKSFLRKKMNLPEINNSKTKELMDQEHMKVLESMKPKMSGTVFIRTHRPELV